MRSVERALECSPATIDFGSLTVGGTAGDCRSRNLNCENTANIPATIWGWSVTEDSSPTFSVEASEVVELAPGSAGPPHVLRLPITFCPRVGRHDAVLTVDIDEGAVRVQLRLMLDGDRGEVSVRGQPSSDTGRLEELEEDAPVTGPRLENLDVRLIMSSAKTRPRGRRAS